MSIYDSLLQIPLFTGLSIETFNEIIEKFKFDFLNYNKNDIIIKKGEECNEIRFVISGCVKYELISSYVKFKLTETVSAPNDILPDYIVGNNQYPINVYAAEDNTGIMIISKNDFMSIIQNYKTVLLNYLIFLSRKAQTPIETFDRVAADNFRARFAFWILYHTNYNSSEIALVGKYKDIYSFFGVQRTIFCNVIDEMQGLGILIADNKMIKILDRKMLSAYYRKEIE